MDYAALGKAAASSETMSRSVVKGRVLQYDADFACYEVADLEEPVQKSFKRLLSHINMKRQLAGAESVNAHITLGTKSGREAMATVKEYQENRDPDKPIKVRVRELRQMLANYDGNVCTPVYDLNYEADDVINMYQRKQIKAHGMESSVIMSGDKDLWMCQGYHCDSTAGKLWKVRGYGKTEYREVGNVRPKLVGEGRSWFWHQMVMGDKVDDIPGLEKITNRLLDVYTPLKSGKPRKAGVALCGEAKAVLVLKGVVDDVMAARSVYALYRDYYGSSADERFIEQAYLLWMQRDGNPYDVVKYLHDICKLGVIPSQEQCTKMDEFAKLVGHQL